MCVGDTLLQSHLKDQPSFQASLAFGALSNKFVLISATFSGSQFHVVAVFRCGINFFSHRWVALSSYLLVGITISPQCQASAPVIMSPQRQPCLHCISDSFVAEFEQGDGVL